MYIYISDKFIVHEWATFRWGVFNEYPNKGENEFYYSTAFGRSDPIRCSIGLLGRMFLRYPNGSAHICNIKGPPDPITGLLDQRCKYYPYPYHNRGTESLMDHQWIREVNYGQFEFLHIRRQCFNIACFMLMSSYTEYSLRKGNLFVKHQGIKNQMKMVVTSV